MPTGAGGAFGASCEKGTTLAIAAGEFSEDPDRSAVAMIVTTTRSTATSATLRRVRRRSARRRGYRRRCLEVTHARVADPGLPAGVQEKPSSPPLGAEWPGTAAVTMAAMPRNGPGNIVIPRWIQLVGLPLVVVGAWLFVSAVNGAVFVFIVAALIAILLNPIVRAFCAVRIPRGLSVLLVYVCFAVAIGGITVIAREVQSVANQVNDQFREDSHGVTPADRKLSDLQRWINDSSPVKVNVEKPGERLLHHVDVTHLQRYSGRAVSVVQSLLITVFESIFNLVLVIVISVYMLLDAPRLSRFLRRVFPGTDPDDDLVTRVERALLSYIRGQTMVSLAVGISVFIGLEILGLTGIFPAGSTYALAFAGWAAVVEIIPYLGPWLGV